MLKKIDNYFFDVLPGFQPMSEDFQKLTGKTCFWLAKWFLAAYFFAYVYQTFFLSTYSAVDIIFVAVLGMAALFWWITLSMKEAPKKQNTMNELRENMILSLLRVLLGVSILGRSFALVGILATAQNVTADIFVGFILPIFLFCLFYFEACTPLPPQPKKMKIKKIAYQ